MLLVYVESFLCKDATIFNTFISTVFFIQKKNKTKQNKKRSCNAGKRDHKQLWLVCVNELVSRLNFDSSCFQVW